MTKLQSRSKAWPRVVPTLAGVFFAGTILVSGASHGGAQLPASADKGEEIYEAKCGGCHSLDANRIGPKHRGVFGRKAGAVAGFQYSAALKRLNVVWTDRSLDRWLRNPTAMAPGTAMGFRLSSAQERADVIAYLKQQSAN